MSTRPWTLASIVLFTAACGADRYLPPAGDGGTNTVSGLPCEVADLLTKHCVSCHGNPPIGSAPQSLVTRADLIAADPYDSTKNNAEGSLLRMQSGTMPPGGGLSAAEITSFENWLNAGALEGSCDGTTQPAALPDLGSVCSSNSYWSHGENERMRPGEACISCHQSRGDGPRSGFLGTVFPSLREPDRCNGQANAEVVITGDNGTELSATTNSAGNFVIPGSLSSLGGGYTAKVIFGGKERAMGSRQTSGDCNACHSAAGSGGAPGRIVTP